VSGVDFSPLGIAVGHATDGEGATGVTVIRHETEALRGGSAVVGRATGTRELAATEAWHVADRVDALLLTGGSAYGLDAAAGVMRWMEERGGVCTPAAGAPGARAAGAWCRSSPPRSSSTWGRSGASTPGRRPP
jgi:L-aminopeptidase/D-esterase-like protein